MLPIDHQITFQGKLLWLLSWEFNTPIIREICITRYVETETLEQVQRKGLTSLITYLIIARLLL